MTTHAVTTGAFERLVRRASSRASAGGRDAPDVCGMCAAPVAAEHAHVLDEQTGEPLCACRACALLFEKDGAGQGHFRLVPDRRVRLTGVETGALGVPVGLAFFVIEPDGTVVARYPSPGGATAWEVEPDAWRAATSGCPELATLCPGTEALLISTVKGADEQWLVPVDDCYRLAGIVREEWTGLSGGDRVWGEIEAYFARLADRCDQAERRETKEK